LPRRDTDPLVNIAHISTIFGVAATSTQNDAGAGPWGWVLRRHLGKRRYGGQPITSGLPSSSQATCGPQIEAITASPSPKVSHQWPPVAYVHASAVDWQEHFPSASQASSLNSWLQLSLACANKFLADDNKHHQKVAPYLATVKAGRILPVLDD
jgi:hypothetical protein